VTGNLPSPATIAARADVQQVTMVTSCGQIRDPAPRQRFGRSPASCR